MFFKHRMKREKFYLFSIFYIYLFFFITNFDFFLLSKMARSTYKSMMIRASKFRTTFFFLGQSRNASNYLWKKRIYLMRKIRVCHKLLACPCNLVLPRDKYIYIGNLSFDFSKIFKNVYLYKSIALFIVYYHLLAIYYLFP